jgi:hypothetical protein
MVVVSGLHVQVSQQQVVDFGQVSGLFVIRQWRDDLRGSRQPGK